MAQDELTKAAFRIFDLTRRAGAISAEPGALVERIRHIVSGANAEDEFIAQAIWSGRCRLVHRLDQDQHPLTSKKEIQVPDLLVVLNGDGLDVPVLVEVKQQDDEPLVLSNSYFSRLFAYSRTVSIPLLVAWRFRSLWTLVDLCMFDRKVEAYHLPIERGFKVNLMGQLLGDFTFVLKEGLRFSLKLKKLRLEDQRTDTSPNTETWHLMIEGVRFYTDSGEELGKLPGSLFWAFMASTIEEELQDCGEYFNLIWKPQPRELVPAWRVPLAALLSSSKGEVASSINFFDLARTEALPFTSGQLRQDLKAGIPIMVRFIFDQQPTESPPWVNRVAAAKHPATKPA